MKKIFFILFCSTFTSFLLPFNAESKSTDPLENRILSSDKRYVTFRYVLDLMTERKVKTIVETGTARYGGTNCAGDGCSTLIWGTWAKQTGACVYSVDVDPQAIKESRNACGPNKKNIKFVCSDSVAFLEQFNKPIDFLYLDSYDFEISNPEASQQHHLKEIAAAFPLLHENSIVMIDDCDLPYGGKGKLAIQYLLDRGWMIALSAYQVILVSK